MGGVRSAVHAPEWGQAPAPRKRHARPRILKLLLDDSRALWDLGLPPAWETGETPMPKLCSSCTHCRRRVRPGGPLPTLRLHSQPDRMLLTMQRQR
ncbi:hypothetical protein NDU88_003882 [Pleurodeles waltl]|uniref:Uncharacterized protein n=1 Tax=Pleurodeles waltl TaxID=8319 RepID=A0AAV7LMU4_PLEWA|nr:hypothetical protein NDU88_003882 [Pleurodeles waltl]